MSNKIKLIGGKFSNGTVKYWAYDNEFPIALGDTVIVENLDFYDIVTVVSIIETTTDNVRCFTSVKLKRVHAPIILPERKEG